jgi:hypothetical protein
MTTESGQLFRELMGAHPRIQERQLEARLVAVLNDAYGFDVAKGLKEMDADAADDGLEVLHAAVHLGKTVIRLPESQRTDGIARILDSLLPPPDEEPRG